MLRVVDQDAARAIFSNRENMKYPMQRPAAMALAFVAATTSFSSHALFKKECRAVEGTLRIAEPDDGLGAWASYGLPAPTRMLRVLVNDSKCFTVVDRGAGLAAAQQEYKLANAGHLKEGQDLHGGQMLGADYALVPDIVSQSENAGGTSIGGSAANDKPKRGLVGSALNLATLGISGRVAGGMSSRKQRAEVVLTLVDLRTSVQLFTTTGEAKISDRAWSAAVAAGSPEGNASASFGRWSNTEIGQVIQAAYEEAYERLIDEVRGRQAKEGRARYGAGVLLGAMVDAADRRAQERQVSAETAGVPGADAKSVEARAAVPVSAGQAAPPAPALTEQTLVVRRIARLLAAADSQSATVVELKAGMMVFPTGARDGVMVEVEDEMGNKGWVPNAAVTGAQ